MSDRPADATDAELAVLRHLWDHGTRTRRQLTDALYPGGGPKAVAAPHNRLPVP
jgi:hypothetical protein